MSINVYLHMYPCMYDSITWPSFRSRYRVKTFCTCETTEYVVTPPASFPHSSIPPFVYTWSTQDRFGLNPASPRHFFLSLQNVVPILS